MAEKKDNWKRFQRISFDSKAFSKRAQKAETNTTRHAHKFVVGKLDSLRNVKQQVIAWLVIVGVLVAAVAVQMFWNQQTYRSVAWKDGGTYAEAVMGPLNTLNPLYASTQAEQSASKLLFSSLYSYDDTGHLQDDLATSMNVTPGGKEYMVTIRDDVLWSDDVKLTSADIVFTVNLMKSADVRSVMYGNWQDVTAEAVNERTIKFTLPAQYASFPHALTFAVLPRHILEDIPQGSIRQSTFSVSPVGSGPFTLRLLQNSPDGRHKIANLSATDHYYKGVPKLARFELHGYNDQEDLQRALQTGEVNAAAGTSISSAELPSTFTTKEYPVNSGVYALLNSDSPILKDGKVRQALQAGTNTAEVRKAIGYKVPELYLPFVSGQLSGTDIPAPVPFDAKKAGELLDQAGWKLAPGNTVRQNSAGTPLELSIITVKDGTYEKVLERMAGQWRQLGIKVNTEIKDPANPTQDFVQATLQPRAYDVLLYKLVIGVDPDVYAYWHSSQATRSGYNFANYRNNIADESLASARTRTEPELRNEKYKTFAEQWLKDVPAIGLYQSVMQYVYRPSVQPDMTLTGVPSEADRYNNVRYWAASQAPVYKTP
ncbi:MAG: peptide/nickel transport system substrate-binding protein [Patescibacteria group bacterium]|nr:peptide/nickel transport system substrate-binding protein [Patescibacteria group bacterium]